MTISKRVLTQIPFCSFQWASSILFRWSQRPSLRKRRGSSISGHTCTCHPQAWWWSKSCKEKSRSKQVRFETCFKDCTITCCVKINQKAVTLCYKTIYSKYNFVLVKARPPKIALVNTLFNWIGLEWSVTFLTWRETVNYYSAHLLFRLDLLCVKSQHCREWQNFRCLYSRHSVIGHVR